MKPIIKYRGGKSKEIPNIIRHIPSFSGRYIEPFFGGGALYFYLEPQKAIINDINSKLMSYYIGVRDNYEFLRRELDLIQSLYEKNRCDFDALKLLHPNDRVEDKNEEFYYELRGMFNGVVDKKYSEALLYFFINKTAYSGMIRYNARGEFNVPYGRYQHLNTQCVSKSHSDLLQKAEIYNKDYSEIFAMCETDDFVFLDPPYDCVFSDYGNDEYRDGFTKDSHVRLADDFKSLPCKALMVIGRTSLTETLYEGYVVDEYAKSYSVNIRNRFKSSSSHLVVANYSKKWNVENRYEFAETGVKQYLLFEAQEPYGNY